MKPFNADRQINLEINNLLQRIKYEANEQGDGAFAYFPLFIIDGNKITLKEDLSTQILFKKLEKMGAIEISGRTCDEINKTLEEAKISKVKPLISEGYWVSPIEPKFSQLCEEYEGRIDEKFEEKLLNKVALDNEKINPQNISYDQEIGVGYVNGKRFIFKDHQPEYRVFAKLYKKAGHKVEREEILSLMAIDIGTVKSVATYKINELVKKMRIRTGLNNNTIVNNNGNLTLVVNPKTTPKQT